MPSVWDGIIGVTQRYIRFPYTAVEQANIKAQFAVTSGFPNVIGAVDCTHITIRAPHMDEFAFVSGKHFHSINVQIICGSNLILINVVAQWPGSAHEPSFVLRHSSVRSSLEAGAAHDGWLVGKIRLSETTCASTDF